MNKYHKCISKHGHLPGWVKTGAVALAIGVGVSSGGIPGPGGAQKMWAGNYRLSIRKKENKYFFSVADLEAEKRCEFTFDGQRVVGCGGSEITPLDVRSSEKDGCTFSAGSFRVYLRAVSWDIVIYNGSSRDSISVTSEVPIVMPELNKVFADGLVFENTPFLNIYSKLQCSSLVLLKCGKVTVPPLGFVSADCVFVSNSTVINQGKFRCGRLLPYDDCHLSGFEKAEIGFDDRQEKKKMIVLSGIDRHDEDIGCFADLNGVIAWYPFDEDASVPFSCCNDYVFRDKSNTGCSYKIHRLKNPVCVFVGEVRDICGSSAPAHKREIRFCITDSSGKILESLVQGAIGADAFTRVICPLHLKNATSASNGIMFKLLSYDCKCPRNVLEQGSSIVFLAEID